MKQIILLLAVSALFATGCAVEDRGGYGGYDYGRGYGYGYPDRDYHHDDWYHGGNREDHFHDDYRR